MRCHILVCGAGRAVKTTRYGQYGRSYAEREGGREGEREGGREGGREGFTPVLDFNVVSSDIPSRPDEGSWPDEEYRAFKPV